ncbi:MAG: hypothetical protein RAP03_06420, partial [Candidatus Electryonea clarkiae]|nr:hypothetical protein [Candidatus Electryonea clarkiae]
DVEIRCLPSEIPDEIVVDVSHVGIQESIHLNELSFEGIEWVTSTERTVAVVQPPRVVEEDIEEEEELLEGEEGEGVEGEEEAASEEGGE